MVHTGTQVGELTKNKNIHPIFYCVYQKHYVTMKISASVLITWAGIDPSGVLVSIKNDDVEDIVVAVLYVAAFLL